LEIDKIKKVYDTIDELREYNRPNFVIAKAAKKFRFSTDARQTVCEFEKGTQKIMNAFMFQQLEVGPDKKTCLIPGDKKFVDLYRPYNGEPLDGKTLLVWRTGGIGDLLFIQPNLIYLKEKYPTCRIVFGCSTNYFQLINNWTCIDEIFLLPTELELFEKCDYHVTFEGVIERCKEAENSNAYRLFSKWMGLNLPDELLIPRQYTKSKNNDLVRKQLEDKGINIGDYVFVQVRTSSPIRSPSAYCWKSIIERLVKDGHTVVIADSPRVHQNIQDFIDGIIEIEYRSKVFNFCNLSTSIDIGISIANYSKLMICPDSAFVHIGAALRKPVLGIYGPFPAKIRMETYLNCDWIEPEPSGICEYGGRYCCIHGHKPCPANINGVSPCMEHIDYDKAFEKAKRLMKC